MKSINRTSKKSLFPIWLCVFIDILCLSTINPFLPQILIRMDISLAHLGFILSISPLVGFFSNILWGTLSDRYGRKKIMLICRFGMMSAYLLLAFSSNLHIFILSRIMDGFFSRTLPISLTIVGDQVNEEERSLKMSNVGIAWIVGGLLGPLLGGFLFEKGIDAIGFTLAIFIACTILITVLGVEESSTSTRKQGNILREILPFNLLADRHVRLRLLQSLFNQLPYFIFVTTSSIFLSERLALTPIEIGELLTIVNATSLVIRLLLFKRLLQSVGENRTLQMGFSLYLGAFLWLSFLHTTWEFMIVNVLISFATSCTLDIMNSILSKTVSKDAIGKVMGMNSSLESISLISGPIIGSNLLALNFGGMYGLMIGMLAMVPLLLTKSVQKQT